jgi:hypothetical protein
MSSVKYSNLDFLSNLSVCSDSTYNCITSDDKDNLDRIKSQIDTNREKYENMNMKYNLEIFNSINMCSGITLLLLYIYYNK